MTKFLKLVSEGLLVVVFIVITLTSFLAGYIKGYGLGQTDTKNAFEKYLTNVSSITKLAQTKSPSPVPRPTIRYSLSPKTSSSWGGPQLWDAVNKSRIEHGVNPLQVKDELCTIASIRLNQLLSLETLDGHEGFSKMATDRPDLKWIFDKYSISEFLVSSATSSQNAVDLWLNSLGHKKLLTGGEYSWGCIYAQNSFGVAIAAY